MEAHIIVNLKFTYYIISAMETRIIVNQKFRNYIKFFVGKTAWLSRIYYDVETSWKKWIYIEETKDSSVQ